MFLLENTGSIQGRWVGRMAAADQRAVFGRKIGKGRFRVCGQTETVGISIMTGYTGHLRDEVFTSIWAKLEQDH